MEKNVLPEFQDFLLARGMVRENYAPFYAQWVSKFLAFSNQNESLAPDLRVTAFLNQLQGKKNISDWQIEQADNALRLYITHYLKDNTSFLYPNSKPEVKKFTDISNIINTMQEALRIKHYSYRTERSYAGWVKGFYYYVVNVKKKDMNAAVFEPDDVKDYLGYLALQKRVSASTQNQAFNALLFLFRNVLKLELGDMGKTVRAKRGERLPVVLSVEEVQMLLKQAKGLSLLMLQLLYGSGLRLMEFARLRVKDIDFGSSLIFVRDGKGNKDRTTMLPDSIKAQLQEHLKKVKAVHEKDISSGYGEVYMPDALGRKYPNAAKEWHWQYAFPSSKLSVDSRTGRIGRHHISEKTIQRVLKDAVRKAGTAKHVTVHTLRHCFATHLLMSGVNIREVQQLLGHKHVETTMIYTHVIRDISKAPKSPLDSLSLQKGLKE